jgi:uncharacterized membrane protein
LQPGCKPVGVLGLASASIVLALLVAPSPSRAQEEVQLGDDDVEVLDDSDVEVDAGEEADAPKGPGRLVGRLHPPIVHFAVAWAVLALPFAMARLRWPGLGRADLVVVAGAAAAACAAVLTGWLHAPDVMARPGIEPLVEAHERSAFALTGLLAAALVVRIVMERRDAKAVRTVYLALLAAVLGLVTYVGHLGGRITFGEGFLPF